MSIILFFLALSVSALGTVAGFGGGVFVVPAMVMFFSIPIEIAVGVTAMSLFPSSVVSSLLNLRKGLIDYKLAWALEVPTIVGAILGAGLTSLIPSGPLEIVFALFLIFIAYKSLIPSRKQSWLMGQVLVLNQLKPSFEASGHRISLWSSSLFGLAAGGLAGLFGIGGGILKTPLMINVFKIPVRRAAATGLFMIVFTSLASGLTHYRLGHIDLEIFVPVASGFLAGAAVGNLAGVKIKDAALKKVIAISIGLAGVAIIVHTTLGK